MILSAAVEGGLCGALKCSRRARPARTGAGGASGFRGRGVKAMTLGLVAALKGRGNGPARGAGREVEREAALGLDHRQQFAGERGGSRLRRRCEW